MSKQLIPSRPLYRPPMKGPLGFVAALTLVLLAGCAAPPPAQEMSEARLALRSAHAVGAQLHYPHAVQVAEDLLRQAQLHLAAGDYRRARHFALAARSRAIAARRDSHSDEYELSPLDG